MKQILNVSLGAKERDFSHHLNILNQDFHVFRVGTDGSLREAVKVVKEHDGKVGVITLGGVNLNYNLGSRQYPLREGQILQRAAVKSSVVDGEIIKSSLEIETVNYLCKHKIVDFRGVKTLIVSVLDRYFMAKALEEAGANLIIGDALFGLGVPIAFKSLQNFELAGRLTLPLIKYIPLKFLYPLGKKQGKNKPKFPEVFQEADVIAGDYHFISRYMPKDLTGKVIITTTVTEDNLEGLKARGAKLLITTSPQFEGRSYGSNILEGIFLALSSSNKNLLTAREVIDIASRIKWEPRIEYLNS